MTAESRSRAVLMDLTLLAAQLVMLLRTAEVGLMRTLPNGRIAELVTKRA
jgi:hypothetical protein